MFAAAQPPFARLLDLRQTDSLVTTGLAVALAQLDVAQLVVVATADHARRMADARLGKRRTIRQIGSSRVFSIAFTAQNSG